MGSATPPTASTWEPRCRNRSYDRGVRRVLLATLTVIGVTAQSACAGLGGDDDDDGSRPGWAEVAQGVAAARESATKAARKPDGEVHNADEFLARARDPASAGKTFLVRAGDYGNVDLRNIRHAKLVTFRAAPGEQALFHYTPMGNTEGLRLEGLHFVGAIDIQPGVNARIELVGNEIGPFNGIGINIRERSSGILIAGNRFHDLREAGREVGYGVRASSPEVEISDLAILGNSFVRLGNDAMELGGVDGLRIERNLVTAVAIEPGSGAHSDPLFIWAGTRNAVVRSNRIVGNSQPVYVFAGTSNVLIENNLIARGDNWCMHVVGARDGERITNLVIRNNTFWDCAFGGLVFSAPSDGWVLVNNVLETLGASKPAGRIPTQAFNLIGKGEREARDLAGRPRFVDRAANDYRLGPGSRGLDAATSEGAPAIDLLGVRRHDDPDARNRGAGAPKFFDIGAFERPEVPELTRLSVKTDERGAALGFELSRRGRVAFLVARRGQPVGEFVRRARGGDNSVRVPASIEGQELAPGRYRVVARALDATGNPSRSRRATFRLARR